MVPARDSDIRPYLPTAGRDFRPQTKRGNFQRLQKNNLEIKSGKWGQPSPSIEFDLSDMSILLVDFFLYSLLPLF